jgi:REP element-mobilizing transposase RayT
MSIPPPKFKDKYRISSTRLKEWDYGSPGYYFITLCTKDRISWFGNIDIDHISFSPSGEIAVQNLGKIPQIYPYIDIDSWVIMPNHIHAIVIIKEMPGSTVETFHWNVSTNNHYLRSGTLGAIINQFKSICTKRIRGLGYMHFAWQPLFYDHIIRNQKSLEKIRAYIIANPVKWTDDEYYSKG